MATVVQSRAMRPIMMRGCEVDHAGQAPRIGIGGLVMSVLPRKNVLAIAAVIDIALNARNGPVSGKALTSTTTCRPGIWIPCYRLSCGNAS